MTAQVVDLFPTGAQADETIRRTIDALIKGKGMKREDVARLAGISKSAFYRKMGATGSANPFAGGELASIARVLGVKVGQLYDGLGGTFIPPMPPDDGIGGERPGPESNWRPFAYKVRLSPLSIAA